MRSGTASAATARGTITRTVVAVLVLMLTSRTVVAKFCSRGSVVLVPKLYLAFTQAKIQPATLFFVHLTG